MSSPNTRLKSCKRVIAHSEIIHSHGSKRLTRNGCYHFEIMLLSLHERYDCTRAPRIAALFFSCEFITLINPAKRTSHSAQNVSV